MTKIAQDAVRVHLGVVACQGLELSRLRMHREAPGPYVRRLGILYVCKTLALLQTVAVWGPYPSRIHEG